MLGNVQASANGVRIERWAAAAALLLFPLVMVQVGREWTWGVAAIAAGVIGAVLLLVELAAGKAGDPAYRAAVTIALAAAFLLTWINLVVGMSGREDDPANSKFFVLVLAAGVGAFAARGRADGMGRAMAGVAAVQAILTALTATDPSTARPTADVVLVSGYFTALWLTSAALFRRSARGRAVTAY